PRSCRTNSSRDFSKPMPMNAPPSNVSNQTQHAGLVRVLLGDRAPKGRSIRLKPISWTSKTRSCHSLWTTPLDLNCLPGGFEEREGEATIYFLLVFNRQLNELTRQSRRKSQLADAKGGP